MSSSENIRRLKEKRKSLEQAYQSGNSPPLSPNRKVGKNFSNGNANGITTNAEDRDNARMSVDMTGAIAPASNRRKGNENTFTTTILEHIQVLEKKVKELEDLEKRVHGIEKKTFVEEENADVFVEDTTYPRDCYSLIALNGPKTTALWYELWGDRSSVSFFLFGVAVFIFQAAFHGMMIFGDADAQWGTFRESISTDADFWGKLIPPDTNIIVFVARILALLLFVIFPNSSVGAVIIAFRHFPRCCSGTKDDPVWATRFSCLLRAIQGMLGIVNAWILIMMSSSVLGIVLSLTAINFISSIDSHAFSLAERGVLGNALRVETSRRIPNEKLPINWRRKPTDRSYGIVVLFTAVILYGFMVTVLSLPDSEIATQAFRVQFNDEMLQQFSGCFLYSSASGVHTYNSYSENSNAAFGYCAFDRRWHLLDDSTDGAFDPCDGITKDVELASSSEMDAGDISSFDNSWSSFGAPVDLYFLNTKELQCGLSLGDGICDEEFNQPEFNYDEGDCCAATCIGPNCGEEVLSSAFDESGAIATGFPSCKDRDNMVSMTIQLNEMTSSRKFMDASYVDFVDFTETQWRDTTPVATNFVLECDGKMVLNAYVDSSMTNKSQTVIVKDGASCEVIVEDGATGVDIATADPIWYIDYTIFHGGKNDKVEILNQESGRVRTASFDLIPDCYFEKIIDQTNAATIYEELIAQINTATIYDTSASSTNEAISWLLEDAIDVSQCGEANFIDRYVLAKMNFAMNGDFIERESQCTWPSIICAAWGSVFKIALGSQGLEGEIPSEISILTSLNDLDLSSNKISEIPSEIGLMSNLEKLNLGDNEMMAIPSEIGSATSLEKLVLSNNMLFRIPTEIGQLTRLKSLHMHDNQLQYLPTEIGQLTSLQELSLNGNQLSSIPTEIALLTNLQVLLLFDNQLQSIPAEIELLQTSQNLTLYTTDPLTEEISTTAPLNPQNSTSGKPALLPP